MGLKKFKCAEREYKIQKILNKHFPNIVPKPISWSNGVLTTEYTDGVRTCNQSQVARQLCSRLKTIKRKFPKFRHNNLKLHNVLLTKNGPMIIGFSKSSFRGGPDTDETFFMNEFRGVPKVQKARKVPPLDGPKRPLDKSKLLDFIKKSGVTVIQTGKK